MKYPFSALLVANSRFRPLALAGACMDSEEIKNVIHVYGCLLATAEKHYGGPLSAVINLFTLGWLNGVRGKMAVQSFIAQNPDHPSANLLGQHEGSFVNAFRELINENKLILFPISLTQFPMTACPLKGAAEEDIKRTAKIWNELFGEAPPSIWLPRGAYTPGIEKFFQQAGCRFICIPSDAFPEHERDHYQWMSPYGLPILPYQYKAKLDDGAAAPVIMPFDEQNALKLFEKITSQPFKPRPVQMDERMIHLPLVYEYMNEQKELIAVEDLQRCQPVFQLRNEWNQRLASSMFETAGILDLEWAYCLYASIYRMEEELNSAVESLRYLLEGVRKDFPDLDYAHQRMRLHYGVEITASPVPVEIDTMEGAILMLSWEYPPNIVGGMARHVHGLAEALVESGREVIVLTASHKGSPEYEIANGVHIYRKGPLHDGEPDILRKTADLNLCLLQKGTELIRDFDVALIHTHDWLTGDAAVLLSETHQLPLISTIHATEHGRNNGLHNDLQRTIADKEKKLISASNTVIVCSQPMKEELRVFYEAVKKEIYVIPNGVEFEKHSSVFSRFGHMRPFIFSIGRMVFEKGFQTFFDIDMKGLKKENIQFIIAGKGPLLKEWRSEAEKRGYKDIIHFVGYVSDEERKMLFQMCEAAVFPSLYEPFGIVALEAMAFKKPVIAAATGGLKSFVLHQQTGLLFEPGNAEDLTRKIEFVLEQPERARELGINGHEMAKELYSWRHISRQTEKVYDQTVFIKKMEGVRT